MGSMIHLAVGKFEIDWGKNNVFHDHSALFQKSDVRKVPYYYVEERSGESRVVKELKEGMAKPLSEAIDRIELLGFTRKYCEAEFADLAELHNIDKGRFGFKTLSDALAKVDVEKMSADYGESVDFGRFCRHEIIPRLKLLANEGDSDLQFSVSEAMENLSPYTVLRLLAANSKVKKAFVTWQYQDVLQGGWADRSDFVRPLEKSHRFLIVTEGSSDARIIKNAFNLLRPHIADFFDYVDMEDGYPFSGTGNLSKFVQGLVSIGIENNVIVIFDNDAEGILNFNRCQEMNIPANMRVLRLPDSKHLKKFNTVGPEGAHNADINGLAASIECYLDLDEKAVIRWTSYNNALKKYQGALEGKERYANAFIKQKAKNGLYDYTKISAIIDMIVSNGVEIKEGEAMLRFNKAKTLP